MVYNQPGNGRGSCNLGMLKIEMNFAGVVAGTAGFNKWSAG